MIGGGQSPAGGMTVAEPRPHGEVPQLPLPIGVALGHELRAEIPRALKLEQPVQLAPQPAGDHQRVLGPEAPGGDAPLDRLHEQPQRVLADPQVVIGQPEAGQ